MSLGRRGLFAGLAAAFATPAIVRAASLMPVRVPPLVVPSYSGLLTIDQVARNVVKFWNNTNAFMRTIDAEYDGAFAVTQVSAGYSLRIRLPADFAVRS